MNKDIIGRGWSFPPNFSIEPNGEGVVEMVTDETEIRQSLEILLTTVRGERYLRPDFGTDLRHYQFEPITPALQMHMQQLVEQALTRYEHRVRVDSVAVNTSQALEGSLIVELSYTILATNKKENLVYPLYL